MYNTTKTLNTSVIMKIRTLSLREMMKDWKYSGTASSYVYVSGACAQVYLWLYM